MRALANAMLMPSGGATPPGPLPYDAEVEYIYGSADKDAYIDFPDRLNVLGTTFSQLACAVEADITFNMADDVQDVFAMSVLTMRCACSYSSSELASVLSGSTYPIPLSSYPDGSRIVVRVDVDHAVYSTSVDGVVVKSGTATASPYVRSRIEPLRVLAGGTLKADGWGDLQRPSSAVYIHSLKVWDADDELVFDLIPVRKDGEGCLYDRVSGEVFKSAGAGACRYGPDKI